MRKQTKLVAVLSTAALLALGASMSSFAATGWAEENGTWVYYDKDGDAVTDTWAKSGENWFYLDEDGEMATDLIVDYNDSYYYVDVNGAMVANTWVSVENEDYDGEDEPATIWYYFGANGKAYEGNGEKPSFKTINGKKYTFDEEGRMQFGWIGEDGLRVSDDDAWKEDTAMYYCGDENDGAQVVGWRFLEIVDADYDGDDNSPMTSSKNVFDDEDQTRWFYFKSNGKKERAKDRVSINGARYGFDEHGRMNAEWATEEDATPSDASGNPVASASEWRYYRSPEEGQMVSKGWFRTVPDERLNKKDYDDDKEGWYYADGKGSLYASEIKEINGKRYAFDAKGKMKSGLILVDLDGTSSRKIFDIKGTDEDNREIDSEDDFLAHIGEWLNEGYNVYYFGDGDSDGAMKTGRQIIDLDGDKFTFNFRKSGSARGAGTHGVDDKKIYVGGMLLKADRDDKYAIVTETEVAGKENVYARMTAEEFIEEYCGDGVKDTKKDETTWTIDTTEVDYDKVYVINTSGAIQNSKNAKDGEDYIINVKSGDIVDITLK
ncbi:cell wall-binding protein [Lacrimispora sp.]|uniref:cell wall-binding protein n=1 Tax=Lacrimispora sp. TaxID=2719234 RepID=UPI0034600F05